MRLHLWLLCRRNKSRKKVEIITPRMILRPLSASDGPALAKATDESWDDLNKWMRWADDRKERTDIGNCTLYTRLCGQKFSMKHDFVFGGFAKNSDQFILTSRLAYYDQEPDSYEFCGYWCRTNQQNKGYMTEAVQAIVEYAFDKLGAKKLYIKHAAGNDKARAVMDKLGFKEEKILSNAHQLPNGQIIDEYLLSLTH